MVNNEELIKKPDIELKIVLTDTGFQADFYKNRKYINTMCRDYDNTLPLDTLKRDLIANLYSLLEEWKKFE